MKDTSPPRLPAGVRRLFRLPFRLFRHIDRDVDDEVRFHLEMREAELVASGMSPEDARAESLRRFGDADNLKAFCKSLEHPAVVRSRARDWLADLGQDVSFAARQFLRVPGFTALAVVTIGLGIGATTTIYCAVHDLLIKPLPYRDADRLVGVDEWAFQRHASIRPTRAVLNAWRRGRSLEDIIEYSGAEWTLGGAGEPQLVNGRLLEHTFTSFLGVRPVLGRTFTAGDAQAGSPPVAMIGEALWRRRFGAARGVVGRDISLDGKPYTVVGVLPRDFGMALFSDFDPPEIFVPLLPGADRDRLGDIARLRKGVTVEEAERELAAVPASDPDVGARDSVAAHLVPLDSGYRSWYRETLLLLLGAVGLVLLIACANVANLILARAWARGRELAIRSAIGAGRGRLVRQLLTESILLGLAGGALGAFLAWRGIPLVVALRPRFSNLIGLSELRLDFAVLAFTLGLAVLSGVVFGLAPAMLATERSVGEALKDATRTMSGRPAARRLRGALVITEIAVSMVLLLGAGLLIRSLAGRVRDSEEMYGPGLLAVDLELPPERFPSPPARAVLVERLVERVRSLPGVHAASSALMSPWAGGALLMEGFEVQGQSPASNPSPIDLGFNFVAPDFFRTAEIPLLAGRLFNPDTAGHEAVVGRAFARRYLPPGKWLGARFREGNNVPWWTVVGVVGDPPHPRGADAKSQPTFYKPFPGSGIRSTIVVRGENSAALLPFVSRAVVQLDPAIHVVRAQTVRMAQADTRSELRFVLMLLGAFAAIAVALAAVGLYGVVAFSVGQRTREIGVRVALGASRANVLTMVLRQGLGLGLLGVLFGLAGGAAATRLLRSRLYGVGPGDPLTFAAVAIALGAVALLASYLPARAALRVDPVEALRADG